MKKGLITVIIPNRAFEKNETLPSLDAQTYRNFEVVEVIDKDAKGASWARNQGLKKANGEFIFWCDNDLDLMPDCLENLHRTLTGHPEADWAYGRFIIDGHEFNKKKEPLPEDTTSLEFVDWFHGITTMSLIRASANPIWDENFKRYDDWDLFLTLTKSGHMPVFCDNVLFKTVNRPHGLSQKDPQDVALNIRKIHKKHFGKLADIIIPHHDQHGMLANCLVRLDNKRFNIIVVSGGSFSENCNKGARIAETNSLIFLNDDTRPVNDLLIQMAKTQEDIVGIAQRLTGHKNVVRYGIALHKTNKEIEKELSVTPKETTVPSGYCFKVSKHAWDKLGGLDEAFINGGEDVDLFLRAKELDMSFGYINEPMQHHLSKSSGRFDYARYNEDLLHKKWFDKL